MSARKKGARRMKVGRPAMPLEQLRRNRIVVMLTDGELAKLHRIAEQEGLGLGTVAHALLAKLLERRP